MRLGRPLHHPFEREDPASWVKAMQASGCPAAYCPLPHDPLPEDALIEAYRQAAEAADILIAEVGVWHVNPISPDADTREAGITAIARGLELAEKIGANCCVALAGSLSEAWAAPHRDHFRPETIDRIVGTVREIIDRVKPVRTAFGIEAMPWVPPESPERYVEILEKVDRDAAACHLDPVNITTSPVLAANSAAFIDRCFDLLGDKIVSAHAKDIRLSGELTVHLSECAPGEGWLDYPQYLRRLNALDRDVPLMIEHLKTADEYDAAEAHIRQIADGLGIEA
ncbi:MAG: sugar phosphate isomerase/epimerase family protein [Opitutales bacterium]